MKFNQILLLSAASAVALARPSDNGCWSEQYNIPCCKETETVVRTTYDGLWGKENGEWCGLGTESTRPADDIVPPHPGLTDLDSVVDPAAECDITDSITGDSLAKEAPFRFGVGLNGVAINTSTTTSKTMRELIKYQFNSVTYSNLMKALFVLDHEGSLKNAANGSEDVALDFSGIVDGLDFAQKNGLHVRGHVLVWHKQTPDWFFRVGFDENNEYADPETIFYRLESYMRQYFGFVNHYYPGVVDNWDVVNEVVEVLEGKYDDSTYVPYLRTESLEGDDNVWRTHVGPDYVINAFRYARKYALPTTKLVYNDYDTYRTTPHDKTQAIIDLMNILRAEDLVDALGMESYLNPESTVEEYGLAIERFAAAGFELQLTEFTIYTSEDDDWQETQNRQYREFFEKVLSYVKQGYNITSFTVFGLQDGYRFYETDSTRTRLFDHDLQKKPNYYEIMNALKAYNAELNETSDDGEELEVSDNDVEEDVDVSDVETVEDSEEDSE